MEEGERRIPRRLLAAVTTVAVVIRLVLWFAYQPVAYGDTPSYRRLAAAVLNGFQRYDGTRTPGYPIFLALVGDDRWVYGLQLLLGLLTTLSILWIGWHLTYTVWAACVMALAHTFNLGQLFFEASLLTETLTTFFLVLAMAGTLHLLTTGKSKTIWLAVGIGLSASLAAITRPLFIYLPFWLLLIVLWHIAQQHVENQAQLEIKTRPITHWLAGLFSQRAWMTGIALLLPAVLILGGWVTFIHERYHMWSLTTMTGYHMIQHTGNFFEYLPDKYANLRDTYLKYRQVHIEEYGTQTNTIWEAIPEMQKVSGLTFYDLSRRLSQLSIWLIMRHPTEFLANVAKGWWLFWRAPVYWQAEAFLWPALARWVSPLVLLERGLLVFANLVFIAASLPVMFIRRMMPADSGRRLFIICLVGTIWIGSVLQSLLDHGDNPRFLVPMQSLVVMWVIWFVDRLWMVFRMKR